ncbi:MAG: EAL domain-containing protein [Sulfurimonas sp.]
MQSLIQKLVFLLSRKKNTTFQKLQENQTLLDTVIHEIPSFLVLKDENGNFLLCNRAVAEFYGTKPEAMVGKHDDDFGVPKEIADNFRNNVLSIMKKGQTSIVMEESRDANTGEIRHFRSIKKPFKDANGKNRILVIATDITDVIESQKQVVKSENLLKEVMSIAKEGIWDWNIATGEITNSPQWYSTLRASTNHKCTYVKEFAALLHPQDRENVWSKIETFLNGEAQSYFSEHRMIRFDGSEIWVQDRGKIIERDSEGKPLRMVGAFTDISEQKNHQNELEHIAHYDALTALPNRVLYADRLQQALLQSKRRETFVAILYLDLDGFKPINDDYGHDIGDILLIDVSQRVLARLREGDTLSRLGGDEFSVILADLTSPTEALPILNRILKSFEEPLIINGTTHKVTASVGVTFYPQKGEDIDGDLLIRQADLAMYNAKQSGKNRYHIFDALHDETIRSKHKMVEKIKQALAHDEFVLHFQPKINMHTREILGAEALIRWAQPNEKLIYPLDFLPFIEDEIISIELGEWVIHEALSQLALLEQHNLPISVSVNVSALQLLSGNFAQKLQTILKKFPDANPARLEIEILETSALENLSAAIHVIQECTSMGVQFSLDDFGTGYSSLSYLKRLPISTLKIDQSFIKDIEDNPDDLIIVQGIISLATAFGKKVIAEGVENEKLTSKLLTLGCQMGQGYGIGRPMPIEEFLEWAIQWTNHN